MLPAHDDSTGWQALIDAELLRQARLGRQGLNARQRAYGAIVDAFHRAYGSVPPPSICAGCGRPRDTTGVTLADGASICNAARLSCFVRYGRVWRTAAARCLRTIGIAAPRPHRTASPRQPIQLDLGMSPGSARD